MNRVLSAIAKAASTPTVFVFNFGNFAGKVGNTYRFLLILGTRQADGKKNR